MWPDQVSNPGPLTYESGAQPTVLHCPAGPILFALTCLSQYLKFYGKLCNFPILGHP